MKKIRTRWTCSDTAGHEHSSRAAARICGKAQAAVDWIDWKLSGVSVEIEAQIRDWWPYSALVAVLYGLAVTPVLIGLFVARGLLVLTKEA